MDEQKVIPAHYVQTEDGGFYLSMPRTLTLEEAFPTASPEEIARLRANAVPPSQLRVTAIDPESGTITFESVAKH